MSSPPFNIPEAAADAAAAPAPCGLRAGSPVPSHEALELTAGGSLATIELNGQLYALRITRQGKLILTK